MDENRDFNGILFYVTYRDIYIDMCVYVYMYICKYDMLHIKKPATLKAIL